MMNKLIWNSLIVFIVTTLWVTFSQYIERRELTRPVNSHLDVENNIDFNSGYLTEGVSTDKLKVIYQEFDLQLNDKVNEQESNSVNSQKNEVIIGRFLLKGIVLGAERFILLSSVDKKTVTKVSQGEKIEGWEVKSINQRNIVLSNIDGDKNISLFAQHNK